MSIRLHNTWILVLVLMTVTAFIQFSENFNLWQRITLAVLVSFLFMAAVAVREFILNLAVSRGETLKKKVTLFVFGGVYQEKPDRVFTNDIPLLFLVRFLSNLGIAAVLYGLYATFVNANYLILAGVTQWLSYIYFLLFLLHFFPAYPLDGGKVLQAILGRSTGDYYKATYIASLIGWATGLFLIFAGVLAYILTRQWLICLVVVSSGLILWTAARYSISLVKTYMVLRPIRALDIMTREYPVMPPDMDLEQLIREKILIKGWPYLIVAEGSQLKGILTLNALKSVPGKRWKRITVGDIMIPRDKIKTVNLQQTADTLLEEMYQRRIDFLPVMEDDNLVGVVTRAALLGMVKIRIGFGA